MAQKDPAHVEISGGKIMLKTFSGGKELNIMNHVRSFDIFESLDNYTITADFYIAEGMDMKLFGMKGKVNGFINRDYGNELITNK